MPSASRDPETGVTVQQEAFAAHMAEYGRPVAAYRACYNAGNMTAQAISSNANKLLNDTAVARRIEHYRQIAVRRLEVSVARLALELARIGFMDPGRLYDDEGNLIPVHVLPEDVRRAIQSVKVVEKRRPVVDSEGVATVEETREIRFWNKNDALKTMAQWKRMLDKGEPADGEQQELADMSQSELEREAREVLAQAVQSGFVKVLPVKKRKSGS